MTVSQGRGVGGCFRAPALHRMALSWRVLPLVAALSLLAACAGAKAPATDATPRPAISVTPRPTSAPQSPAPGDALAPGDAPAPGTGPSSSARSLTLTIWGPDFIAPLDDVPGGSVLAAQIDAFSKAHPGWNVRYVRKMPYGQGGLTHFMRATAPVAPELLPDLALVDMREVGLLTESGLLQPLEPLLDPAVTADLVPFARQAGEVGEHLVAVQYEADLRFLAYNSAVISKPPATWAELLDTHASYLFPAGASEGAVADAFLPQYLALGGKLTDRDGKPYLDQAVTAAILEAYQSARLAGVLAPDGLKLEDASDCWPIYLTSAGGDSKDDVAMTNVTSWDYGRERARLASTRIAPLPTLSGVFTSMASGWGWVLVSKDPARQEAATAFLDALLQPQAMAAWAEATYHLPTRRSALRMAIDDEDYLRFLERLMEVASPQPRDPAYSSALDALRPAIQGVTQGTLSPQAAAAQAAERIRTTQEQLRSGSQQ